MKKMPIPPFFPGTMIHVPRDGKPARPSQLIQELTFLRHSLQVMANPPPRHTIVDYLRLLTTVTDSLRCLLELVRTHEALLAAGEPLAQQLSATLEQIGGEIGTIREQYQSSLESQP